MTCIVGYKDRDRTYLGADSAASSKNQSIVRSDWKVFVKENMIIGFSDSFRFGQLLEYIFKPPPWDPLTQMYLYMIKDFIPALREFLEGEHFSDYKKIKCGQFLIGARGSLFKVGRDFQVASYPYHYLSIGAGSPYALGAMHALERFDKGHISAKERIRDALSAAAEFCNSVREPFNIVNA